MTLALTELTNYLEETKWHVGFSYTWPRAVSLHLSSNCWRQIHENRQVSASAAELHAQSAHYYLFCTLCKDDATTAAVAASINSIHAAATQTRTYSKTTVRRQRRRDEAASHHPGQPHLTVDGHRYRRYVLSLRPNADPAGAASAVLASRASTGGLASRRERLTAHCRGRRRRRTSGA
jgi:hypothetical protein